MCRRNSSTDVKLYSKWIFIIIQCDNSIKDTQTLQNNLSIHTAGSDGALYCNIYGGHIL